MASVPVAQIFVRDVVRSSAMGAILPVAIVARCVIASETHSPLSYTSTEKNNGQSAIIKKPDGLLRSSPGLLCKCHVHIVTMKKLHFVNKKYIA